MDLKDNVLMKSNMFKNAYQIYQGGGVNIQEITWNKIYFEVKDLGSEKIHVVSLGYDSKSQTTGVDCDCTFQSLKSKHKPLCAHIVAAILYSGFQLGRPRRR